MAFGPFVRILVARLVGTRAHGQGFAKKTVAQARIGMVAGGAIGRAVPAQ